MSKRRRLSQDRFTTDPRETISVLLSQQFVARWSPTRLAAVERARKVRELARRPGTPAEGEAAEGALSRIMTENSLTESDLDANPKAATFQVVIRRGPAHP